METSREYIIIDMFVGRSESEHNLPLQAKRKSRVARASQWVSATAKKSGYIEIERT